MLAAVKEGDVKKVAEVIRQDPGFNVNMDHSGDGLGRTLLHSACLESHRSAVIPLLLAHPGIDVNVKNRHRSTPFYYACAYGRDSCVRELLKDSRVKANEPVQSRHTPLWAAVATGHLEVIKWWIASGRELDLGTPGNDETDAIGEARRRDRTEVVTPLERFKENPGEIRHEVRVELGWYDEAAAARFALMVFVSDGLLQIKDVTSSTPAARYYSIARNLPLELQMVLCFRQVGSAKEIIPGKDSEEGFKSLAKSLLWPSFFTS